MFERARGHSLLVSAGCGFLMYRVHYVHLPPGLADEVDNMTLNGSENDALPTSESDI